MKEIESIPLARNQAALFFLGQAGYLIRAGGKTIVIDPYLSDSVGKIKPLFSRLYPPPISPEDLKTDLFIVTHDHLDHLDPETIKPYKYKKETIFIGPRLACKKLKTLGIKERNIIKIDSGEKRKLGKIKITGVYAIPNEASVIDTTGYLIEFANGRSLYHSSDTGFSELLLACVPRAEVFCVCINGKMGNLSPSQAARVAGAVNPKIAIPNHYDIMRLNSENPELFAYLMSKENPKIKARVLKPLEPFIWR